MQVYGRSAAIEVPRFANEGLAKVPLRDRAKSVGPEISKSRRDLRYCVLGASALILQPRRIVRRARRAIPFGNRIDAAINVGKDASRLLRMKKTDQERKRIRQMEVRRKIEVLKGKKGSRKAPNPDEDEGGRTEDEGGRGLAASKAEASSGKASSDGEGPEAWAFKRNAKVRGEKRSSLMEVSDGARAVAETELNGAGVASSRQLMDAAREFEAVRDFNKASDLLELVNGRISEEQLQRKLDYKLAQEYDDEACEQLAGVYFSSGRLTLAFNTYDTLRMKTLDAAQRKRAQVGWLKVAMKLSCRLQEGYRYQESLDLLLLIRDVANTRVAGDKLAEEAEMYIAICLQKVGRQDEAMEVLNKVSRTSYSRDRKAQAQFIMDVMSVDVPDQRNEEFHKVWEQNFNLPKDMTRSATIGTRRTANLNLSTQERAFRSWASEYWEERLKSPAYYFLLTLWVTWPFAIPVVSIMRRSGLIE